MRLMIRPSQEKEHDETEEIAITHETNLLDFHARQNHRCIQRMDKTVVRIKAVDDEHGTHRNGSILVEEPANRSS
jgi:hydrogenase maturation factor HypF (carbamoyltransferase family)